MRCLLSAIAVTVAFATTANAQPAKVGPAFEQEPYGKMPSSKDKNGKEVAGPTVTLFTLINKNNVVLKCIEYGAIITELHVPDKDGKMADVVLGFDKLEDYLKGHPYFGTNAGRCANRIANAKFTLDGKEYTITKPGEKDAHTLHGGKNGFDKKLWKGEPFLAANGPGVKFSYVSPDGEEGYPGKLTVSVTYILGDSNELVVEYRATTDKTTICNLAHHSYFNLAGHNSGTILDQVAEFNAKNYTPADDTLIPTGKIAPVEGTPFDFTKAKAMGKDLEKAGGKPVGFDLNYVIDAASPEFAGYAGKVTDPKSGRTLKVITSEPGLQFYTGNFLDGTIKGKGGTVYPHRGAFCLETQHYPDSPNQPNFPSTILRPGTTHMSRTIFVFGVVK